MTSVIDLADFVRADAIFDHEIEQRGHHDRDSHFAGGPSPRQAVVDAEEVAGGVLREAGFCEGVAEVGGRHVGKAGGHT